MHLICIHSDIKRVFSPAGVKKAFHFFCKIQIGFFNFIELMYNDDEMFYENFTSKKGKIWKIYKFLYENMKNKLENEKIFLTIHFL